LAKKAKGVEKSQKLQIWRHEGKFNIPGWNSVVKPKHQIAKAAFRLWVNCNRPKTSDIYRNMTKTKKDYKYSLRQCHKNT